MPSSGDGLRVRATQPADFSALIELSRTCYPEDTPWTRTQLGLQRLTFPAGQLVAVDLSTDRVVGMAASLIVTWDDYDVQTSWRDFTDNGTFANHDPSGRTLYAADVMVDPRFRRRGIGSRLYAARRTLLRRLGLARIRSGARLRSYHGHAGELSAEEYVTRIVDGRIQDPTLSFQLRQGFRVLAVAPDYLPHDPKSLGYAAVVEWTEDPSAVPRGPA